MVQKQRKRARLAAQGVAERAMLFHDLPIPQPRDIMTGPFGSASILKVATCTLNQWALDFDGNLQRSLESCTRAKQLGCSYRLGPELELCGYGCEDHFLELDTFAHCWESLVELLLQGGSDDLLIDVGMPVLFQGVRYNCRVLCFNRRILLIRPKVALADNGNYRESRYFTAYPANVTQTHTFWLPGPVQDQLNQQTCPFGCATSYLNLAHDVTIACESCEELWTPQATHIALAVQAAGVLVIGNGSGSHAELRKLNTRLELMIAATRKCGGLYLYSNQRGCDGGRLYYDGAAVIVANGQLLAQADQFALHDVQVISATVDLDEIRSYRASIPSFGIQVASSAGRGDQPKIHTGIDHPEIDLLLPRGSSVELSLPMQLQTATPMQECALGPACWLWDYLRRTRGASGFLLPLSGGADSASVATIVGCMCVLVVQSVKQGDEQVLADIQRICGQESSWKPSSPQEIASHIFHTLYLGTEHSSQVTQSRATRLAASIGAHHWNVPIDLMVRATVRVFSMVTDKHPRFVAQGGTETEDLALQNIQARLRMVVSYLFAQLIPWVVGAKGGFLLVLASANVDEGLRGYLTKYDCSSADLNPIGAIAKGDLKRMLQWASEQYDWPVLAEIAGAPPTAELRPNASGDEHSQKDEDEMGMTYEELGIFGKLRKVSRAGPVSMFRLLVQGIWKNIHPPKVIAEKVQRFFIYYARNRHKLCTLTPSYHAEGYSPDDNRFDLRPFLYNTLWPRQFQVMNQLVSFLESRATATLPAIVPISSSNVSQDEISTTDAVGDGEEEAEQAFGKAETEGDTAETSNSLKQEKIVEAETDEEDERAKQAEI